MPLLAFAGAYELVSGAPRWLYTGLFLGSGLVLSQTLRLRRLTARDRTALLSIRFSVWAAAEGLVFACAFVVLTRFSWVALAASLALFPFFLAPLCIRMICRARH
jgi:hypothetical protein